LPAGRPHALHGIVMAIEVVHVGLAPRMNQSVVLQEAQPLLDLGAVVNAGAEQGGDTRRGARKTPVVGEKGESSVATDLVDKRAVQVLRFLDVLDAMIASNFGTGSVAMKRV